VAEQSYFELVEGPDQIWELVFDVPGVGYNTFSQAALKELADAVDALTERSDIDGLIVRSAKDSFCVGMDISEFPGMFEMKQSEIEQNNVTTSPSDSISWMPCNCLLPSSIWCSGHQSQ